MAEFADHFSKTSDAYATYRPHYPDALFEWLASIAPRRDRVWDCGTGSGQAAVALSKHFREVIATDPSKSQLSKATPAPNVDYAAMTAERCALRDQALHWFRHDEFYQETRRVLVANGAIAVWSYGLLSISERLNEPIHDFYRNEVGPFWPAERAIVDAGYADIVLPFREIVPPKFAMEAHWTLEQFVGYVGTWSAVIRYRDARGIDPVPGLVESIRPLWGNRESRERVRWPLEVKAGLLQ